jgi:hypothetical protein
LVIHRLLENLFAAERTLCLQQRSMAEVRQAKDELPVVVLCFFCTYKQLPCCKYDGLLKIGRSVCQLLLSGDALIELIMSFRTRNQSP